MLKILSIIGMAISGLIALVFILHLVGVVARVEGQGTAMSIGMIVCSAALAFLSWNCFRENSR